MWGAFANQGQVCVSVERVYAHQAVHDELVRARSSTLTQKLRLGEPGADHAIDVGSMTWERQVEIVEERVKSAVDAGRQAAHRRQALAAAGCSSQPTVLTDCRQEMDVMKKEIFGPVLPIMKVRDEEEAVALANDSHLGLMAYVFTQDRPKGQRLAERIEAGTVMVNDCLLTFGAPETPWARRQAVGRRPHALRRRAARPVPDAPRELRSPRAPQGAVVVSVLGQALQTDAQTDEMDISITCAPSTNRGAMS